MELSYERLAMRNDPMPDGLPLEDQLCYQGLSFLYSRYHSGTIDREQGKKEARMIRFRCLENRKKMAFERKCGERSVRLWREIESASNAYAKNRTLENADRLVAVIYGLETG